MSLLGVYMCAYSCTYIHTCKHKPIFNSTYVNSYTHAPPHRCNTLFNKCIPIHTHTYTHTQVQYSIQTRCQIMDVENDRLIQDQLQHFKVKFPLPGISGLMDGEVMCYSSQECADFEVCVCVCVCVCVYVWH